MFLSFVCLFSVFGSCLFMYYSVPSLVCNHLDKEEGAGLYLIVLLMSMLCSVALPHVAVGWSAL